MDAQRGELADLLKRLRRRRSWSQAQLAQASGLSLRTVQRIESSGHCAPESLLALASAMDVDVDLLTAVVEEPEDDQKIVVFQALARALPARQIEVASLIAIFPALFFISAMLLKEGLGVEWLSAPIDALTADPKRLQIFNAVTPGLFVGGALFALVLNLLAVVDFEIRKVGTAVSSTVSVMMIPKFIGNITTSVVLLGAMVGYGAKYVIADIFQVILAHLG